MATGAILVTGSAGTDRIRRRVPACAGRAHRDRHRSYPAAGGRRVLLDGCGAYRCPQAARDLQRRYRRDRPLRGGLRPHAGPRQSACGDRDQRRGLPPICSRSPVSAVSAWCSARRHRPTATRPPASIRCPRMHRSRPTMSTAPTKASGDILTHAYVAQTGLGRRRAAFSRGSTGRAGVPAASCVR